MGYLAGGTAHERGCGLAHGGAAVHGGLGFGSERFDIGTGYRTLGLQGTQIDTALLGEPPSPWSDPRSRGGRRRGRDVRDGRGNGDPARLTCRREDVLAGDLATWTRAAHIAGLEPELMHEMPDRWRQMWQGASRRRLRGRLRLRSKLRLRGRLRRGFPSPLRLDPRQWRSDGHQRARLDQQLGHHAALEDLDVDGRFRRVDDGDDLPLLHFVAGRNHPFQQGALVHVRPQRRHQEHAHGTQLSPRMAASAALTTSSALGIAACSM